MIRKATPSDLHDIYRIYSERYDSHDASSIKYTKDDWEWYLTNDTAIILVMEHEEVIGLTFTYNMGIWGYMEHVVVDERYRDQGHARALIEETLNVGRSLGWRLLEACYYSEIDQMKTFFERIGWQDGGISTRWVFRELPLKHFPITNVEDKPA